MKAKLTLSLTAVAVQSSLLLLCPAGVAAPAPPEAMACANLCMNNPSFETGGGVGGGSVPTPYGMCGDTPDTYDNGGSSGPKYVGIGAISSAYEGVTQQLCAPIQAGGDYNISIDIKHYGAFPFSDPGVLEIWCGNANCNEGTLLWSSPQITSGQTTWQTHNAVFTAPSGCTHITFRTRYISGSGTYLYIDNIVDNNPPCGPPTVTVTASPQEICAGECTDVEATAMGGTAPYTYTWSPNIGTTAGPLNVCPTTNTTYSVTVTDNAGQTATGSVAVTVTPAPCSPPCVQGDTLCFNNPSFEDPNVTPSCDCVPGGACGTQCLDCVLGIICNNCPCSGAHKVPAPWNTCMSNYTPDTQPGSWGVTLPPSHGQTYIGLVHGGTWQEGASQQLCSPMVAGKTYVINLDIAKGQGDPASGILNNGCAEIQIWGGNAQCTKGALLWSSGRIQNTNWQTYVATLNPGANYTHFLIIIQEVGGGGCTASDPGGTNGPYLVVDNIVNPVQACAPNVTVTATPDSLCPGACTNVQANATGGTPPYTYAWSPNIGTTAGPLNVCPTVTTTYRVTVTDNNGDSDTASVLVTVNSPPSLSTSVVNPTCNGLCDGTATVTATGSSPFTYLWDNAASSQTTATATGLCVGTYCVTVTDANGCTDALCASLTAPPAMTLTTTKVDLLCNGVCDGSATVTATGGTTPYTYNWPAGGSGSTQTGLCAGTWTVTVTDANGCTNTASVTLTEPPLLSVTASGINASCNGLCDGSATATPAGGTAPYTYNWSPAGSGSAQSGLCAGTYTVTVTDNNACTATATVTVTQPPAIVLSTSSLDADCGVANGTATVTATGGTGGFTYLWNDASSHTSATATGIGVGSYGVTVTDANGCTADTTVIVNEVGGFPVSITKTDVTCNGACDGSATATPGAGNAPYTYLWNDAASQTTATASGLCPGTYGVTMTDNTGCSGSQSVIVTQPPALIAAETHTNVSCNGGADGSIDLTATGGTPSNTYLWDNGATTEDLSNLAAGNYCVTVSDSSNCTAVVCATITEPAAVVLGTSSTQATCNQCNGTATVTVTSGGTAPFTYLWDNAATSQTTATASSLCAGSYTVTATDGAGCTETITAAVSNIGAPAATITAVSNATCNGVCDGTATVTATGGQGPYTYSWNNAGSQTTATATGLCAGAYTVSVTDALGCMVTADTVVTEPTAISVTTTGTDESCSQSNGSATVTATGGTGAYTYNWSPSGQTTATASGLAAGTHCVTVTDANNCSRDTCVTITNIAGPVAGLSATNVCLGTATPFIYLSTGSITTCLWDFGDGNGSATCGSVTHTYGSAGTYTVLHCVSDNAGCQSCDSTAVTVSPIPVACFGDSVKGCVPVTANFTNCSTGGSTYAWDFGDGGTSDQQNPAHTFTSAGCRDIRLTVTSAAGCTATQKKDCYVEGYNWPKANFDLTPKELTILNPTVNFFDKSVNATALYWDFGDNTTDTVNLNPTHIYGDTGCYEVTLIRVNQQGCADTTRKEICVKDIYTLYIPTAFSPNKDGSNDLFAPLYYGICEFEMYIFDRWGNLIYQTTSLKGWDGTANGGTDIVQQDVYVWLVRAKDCAGKEINKTGHVTVVK